MSKYKIALGMITGNNMVHWGLIASFMEMLNSNINWSKHFEFTPIFQPGLYVPKLRNAVAAHFLHGTDCEYLWLLDYDNGFHPESLLYFMKDFKNPDIHIVSGKYFHKNTDNAMVAGISPPHAQDTFFQWLPEGANSEPLINLSREMGSKGGCVGCGCLMVRRKVFEEVPFPWFETPYRQYEDGGWSMIGEDAFFCIKAEEYGFDIYLDQRIKSPHHKGDKCYPEEWRQHTLKEK
jgi:GT2 family glycosyltransferase